MIEARELRIGNIVTDQFYESFKTTIDIESITEEGINVCATDDNKPYGMHSPMLEVEYGFDELCGVPLTAEWLERFGFEDNGNGLATLEHHWNDGFGIHFCLELDDFSISLIPLENLGSVDYLCPHVKLTKHVNQLQNLYFALTGEELKAESK